MVPLLFGVLWGCGFELGGLPGESIGFPEGCQEPPYGSVHWTIGGFYQQDQLVDPAAVPLVAKVRVGEQVGLWITGTFCGVNPTPEWISTNPRVATVVERGVDTASLTGFTPGRTVIYALKYGSRADLEYYCCPPCETPTPPPSCQRVPIESVEVVP